MTRVAHLPAGILAAAALLAVPQASVAQGSDDDRRRGAGVRVQVRDLRRLPARDPGALRPAGLQRLRVTAPTS